MKYSALALLLSALLVLTAACAPSAPGPDVLATTVAATLAAMPPEPEPTLLPRALYLTAADANDILQIFRVEPDGITRTQLTFEPAAVAYFDVSPLDGGLAYISNNQLLRTAADGSGRTLIVDGGPEEQTADFFHYRRVSSPVWSPDGSALYFGQGGVNRYDLAAGSYVPVLPNTTQTAGNPFLRERYSPASFSPDGTRLLVYVGWYEGGSLGVLDLASGSFMRFDQGIVGGDVFWLPDSSAVLVASQYTCYLQPGLWRYDAVSGAVTTLLPSQNPDGSYNLVANVHLAPDGQMYFFFANVQEAELIECGLDRLNLVRAGWDGVTGRTVLYPEPVASGRGLWFPDASGVLLVESGGENQPNRLVLLRLDGSLPQILGSGVQLMRWAP